MFTAEQAAAHQPDPLDCEFSFGDSHIAELFRTMSPIACVQLPMDFPDQPRSSTPATPTYADIASGRRKSPPVSPAPSVVVPSARSPVVVVDSRRGPLLDLSQSILQQEVKHPRREKTISGPSILAEALTKPRQKSDQLDKENKENRENKRKKAATLGTSPAAKKKQPKKTPTKMRPVFSGVRVSSSTRKRSTLAAVTKALVFDDCDKSPLQKKKATTPRKSPKRPADQVGVEPMMEQLTRPVPAPRLSLLRKKAEAEAALLSAQHVSSPESLFATPEVRTSKTRAVSRLGSRVRRSLSWGDIPKDGVRSTLKFASTQTSVETADKTTQIPDKMQSIPERRVIWTDEWVRRDRPLILTSSVRKLVKETDVEPDEVWIDSEEIEKALQQAGNAPESSCPSQVAEDSSDSIEWDESEGIMASLRAVKPDDASDDETVIMTPTPSTPRAGSDQESVILTPTQSTPRSANESVVWTPTSGPPAPRAVSVSPSLSITPRKRLQHLIPAVVTVTDSPLVITDRDPNMPALHTLEPRQWLDDGVIHKFLEIVTSRADTHLRLWFFDSFLIKSLTTYGHGTSSKWCTGVDIFEKDFLFFPVNLADSHWILIVANMKEQTLTCYDSVNPKVNCGHVMTIKVIREFLNVVHQDKYNKKKLPRSWYIDCPGETADVDLPAAGIPVQQNTFDCGVFVCAYAEAISRGANFDFDQSTIPAFRLWMKSVILAGSIVNQIGAGDHAPAARNRAPRGPDNTVILNPVTNRRLSSRVQHIRSEIIDSDYPGVMDDYIKAVRETYILEPGNTEIGIREALADALDQPDSNNDEYYTLYIESEVIEGNIPVVDVYTKRGRIDLSAAMEKIERVNQSHRKLLLSNALTLLVYRVKTKTGSGWKSDFVEDEAEHSESDSEYEDIDSDASTLMEGFVNDEDLFSDDERPGFEPAADLLPSHLRRNLPSGGIIESIIRDDNDFADIIDSTCHTEIRNIISTRQVPDRRKSPVRTVLPPRVKHEDFHAHMIKKRESVLRTEEPRRGHVKRRSQFSFKKIKQVDLKQITRNAILIKPKENCLPKAIVYLLLTDYLDRVKAAERTQLPAPDFPDALLGQPRKGIPRKGECVHVVKLLANIRKYPDGRGPVVSHFQDMVKFLMMKAGLKDAYERASSGPREWKLLNDVLKESMYNLVIYDHDGSMLFQEKHFRDETLITVMLDHEHYLPVKRTNEKVFCRFCRLVYNERHACPLVCPFCFTEDCDLKEPGDTEKSWVCECRAMMKNEKCLSNHKKHCKAYCDDCGRKRTSDHRCNDWKCRTCGHRATLGHKCFMYHRHEKKDVDMRFAFYDLETALVPSVVNNVTVNKHQPVMASVTFMCDRCELDGTCGRDIYFDEGWKTPPPDDDDDDDDERERARVKEREDTRHAGLPIVKCRTVETFTGDDCVSVLLSRLREWSKKKKRAFKNVVFAHCGAKFDHHFLFREMIRQGLTPSIIKKGNQFLCISLAKDNLKFLDSYRFIPLRLAEFHKSLGLTGEHKKSFWPHKLTEPLLRDLKEFPQKEFYEYKKMNERDRAEFDVWYESEDKSCGFPMKQKMKEYCEQDVKILAEGVFKFRDMWMASTPHYTDPHDPFRNKVTLAGAVMELFKAGYLRGDHKLPITPERGYNAWKKSSAIGTLWMNEEELRENITIERERYLGTDFVFDGVRFKDVTNEWSELKTGRDDHVITVYDFLGCYYHACVKCFPDHPGFIRRMKPSKKLELIPGTTDEYVAYDVTPARMHAEDKRRELYCKFRKWEYKTIREHDYKEHMNSLDDAEWLRLKAEMRKIEADLKIGKINHRAGMQGGRSEVFKLHYKCTAGERIEYFDVSGLYPSVLMKGMYCNDHPVELTEDESLILRQGTHADQLELVERNLGKINYYMRAFVLPPSDLRIPFVPTKVNDRLVFPLCRTCTATKMTEAEVTADSNICKHRDSARQFEAYLHSAELVIALKLGYQIMSVVDVEKYLLVESPFLMFIMSCMLEKKRAERDQNPGRRFIEKLKANSFWGGFAKNSNFTQSKMCNVPQMLQMFANPENEIVGVTPFGAMSRIDYRKKKQFQNSASDTSLINASMVTSYARVELYKLLSVVDPDDLCYCDTDSIVFIVREGQENPLTPFLNGQFNPPAPEDPEDPFYSDHRNLAGGLENEVEKDFGPGHVITQWIAPGPKEYAYHVFEEATRFEPGMKPKKTVTKCKGLTLSGQAFDTFNFDYMMSLVKTGTGVPIPQPKNFLLDTRSNVISKDHDVQPTFNFNKRMWCTVPRDGDDEPEITTLPFGWRPERASSAPANCFSVEIPLHHLALQTQSEEETRERVRDREELSKKCCEIRDSMFEKFCEKKAADEKRVMLEAASFAKVDEQLLYEAARDYVSMLLKPRYRGFTNDQLESVAMRRIPFDRPFFDNSGKVQEIHLKGKWYHYETLRSADDGVQVCTEITQTWCHKDPFDYRITPVRDPCISQSDFSHSPEDAKTESVIVLPYQ